MVAKGTKKLLKIVVSPGQLWDIVAVKQAKLVGTRDFQEMLDGRFKGVGLLARCSHGVEQVGILLMNLVA